MKQPTTTTQPETPANTAEIDLDTINQTLAASDNHPLETFSGWNLLSPDDRERILSFAEVVIDKSKAKAGDPDSVSRQKVYAASVKVLDTKIKSSYAIRQRAKDTLARLFEAVCTTHNNQVIDMCSHIDLLAVIKYGDDIDPDEPNASDWVITEAEKFITTLKYKFHVLDHADYPITALQEALQSTERGLSVEIDLHNPKQTLTGHFMSKPKRLVTRLTGMLETTKETRKHLVTSNNCACDGVYFCALHAGIDNRLKVIERELELAIEAEQAS